VKKTGVEMKALYCDWTVMIDDSFNYSDLILRGANPPSCRAGSSWRSI